MTSWTRRGRECGGRAGGNEAAAATYTAEYKRRLLKEAEPALTPGAVGRCCGARAVLLAPGGVAASPGARRAGRSDPKKARAEASPADARDRKIASSSGNSRR